MCEDWSSSTTRKMFPEKEKTCIGNQYISRHAQNTNKAVTIATINYIHDINYSIHKLIIKFRKFFLINETIHLGYYD